MGGGEAPGLPRAVRAGWRGPGYRGLLLLSSPLAGQSVKLLSSRSTTAVWFHVESRQLPQSLLHSGHPTLSGEGKQTHTMHPQGENAEKEGAGEETGNKSKEQGTATDMGEMKSATSTAPLNESPVRKAEAACSSPPRPSCGQERLCPPHADKEPSVASSGSPLPGLAPDTQPNTRGHFIGGFWQESSHTSPGVKPALLITAPDGGGELASP